jgi:hypothetical protein
VPRGEIAPLAEQASVRNPGRLPSTGRRTASLAYGAGFGVVGLDDTGSLAFLAVVEYRTLEREDRMERPSFAATRDLHSRLRAALGARTDRHPSPQASVL